MSLNLPSYALRMVFFVLIYRGHFLPIAYWKQLCAKPVIDYKKRNSSWLQVLSVVQGLTTFPLTSWKSYTTTSDVVKSNRPVLMKVKKTDAKWVVRRLVYCSDGCVSFTKHLRQNRAALSGFIRLRATFRFNIVIIKTTQSQMDGRHSK